MKVLVEGLVTNILLNMAFRAVKQALRKQVKAAINGLSDVEKERQSKLLINRVIMNI